jgi:hypothetical protein
VGSIFTPEEFQKYERNLAEARKILKQEELKIGLFRNYDGSGIIFAGFKGRRADRLSN